MKGVLVGFLGVVVLRLYEPPASLRSAFPFVEAKWREVVLVPPLPFGHFPR